MIQRNIRRLIQEIYYETRYSCTLLTMRGKYDKNPFPADHIQPLVPSSISKGMTCITMMAIGKDPRWLKVIDPNKQNHPC